MTAEVTVEVAEAMVVAGWAEVFGIRWLLKSKTLQKLQKPSPFDTSFSLSAFMFSSNSINNNKY